MRKILLSLALALSAVAAWAGSTAREQYTIIVSLDAFRWDYSEAFDTPFFDQLAAQGVKAVMQPSFPSKTFPNHYTLATGLYPDHHGIVANSFRSCVTGKRYAIGNEQAAKPDDYGGDPIWLTAKRQGVTTATLYWVGSNVAVKGQHANYWHNYVRDSLMTFPERTHEVLRLLQLPEKQRPHLIMAYFEEPDESGHNFGPISKHTRRVVESLDSLLGAMWQRIQALPIAGQVNLIITGDHGMTWIDSQHRVPVSRYIKPEWGTVDGSLPGFVYVNRPDYADSVLAALKGVPHIWAWKRQDVPSYLHYGTNASIGDVVVLPDVGWLWMDSKPGNDTAPLVRGGAHGFDNTAIDMQVGFRAIGPAFKQGYVKPQEFRNVCVYPLLCHLLGVQPSPCDGTLAEVQDMLR